MIPRILLLGLVLLANGCTSECTCIVGDKTVKMRVDWAGVAMSKSTCECPAVEK